MFFHYQTRRVLAALVLGTCLFLGSPSAFAEKGGGAVSAEKRGGASLDLAGLRPAFQQTQQTECVNIYYDKSADPSYWMGRTYATMLQNLLGHFPELQQVVSPIENYQAGDIEKCRATFYLGTYFENKIPAAFYTDFIQTQKRVAWLGYNIWRLPPGEFERTFGYHYAGLTKLDREHLDKNGAPTFFKDVLYKGETFSKYGKFAPGSKTDFRAAFEMTILSPTENSQGQVLAQARHNGSGETLPYAVRSGSKFYLTDIPFSFFHEGDRYLVFCDLLFDILDLPPRRTEHLALARIEDVHALVPVSYLYTASKILEQEQVPLNVALIPIFFDPLKNYTRLPSDEFVTLKDKPEFTEWLREVTAKGASMIWHGSTHQIGSYRNPFSAVSGDDFEFWDANKNGVLADDSPNYVLDRLDTAFHYLRAAGITPLAWETPHYQASPLDYLIFARVLPWNVGRIIYFNEQHTPLAPLSSESELWYSAANDNAETRARRAAYFQNLQSEHDEHWSGQLFPFELYGDVYGQRVLPENLGNAQPIATNFVSQPRSVQEMLADAKRNLVIRDSWASFFYHVQLFNIDENGGTGRFPGDPADLAYLVRGIKKLGYRFVSANDFMQKNLRPVRPTPVYKNAFIKERE